MHSCEKCYNILKDDYDIDCGENCDYTDAKKKYRKASIKYHPDKHMSSSPDKNSYYTEKFKELNQCANKVIIDKCVKDGSKQQSNYYEPEPKENDYNIDPFTYIAYNYVKLMISFNIEDYPHKAYYVHDILYNYSIEKSTDPPPPTEHLTMDIFKLYHRNDILDNMLYHDYRTYLDFFNARFIQRL